MRGKQLPETFREGEFIESLEGLIFDVKGLVHPKDRVVAFVRYIPDPQGSRMRGTVAYRKVYEFSERYSYLQRAWPEYLVHDPVFDEEIIEVPRDRISKHYKPLEKTRELLTKPRTNLEKKTTEMITALASASQIPKEDLGVSGSILVGLAGPESDIDIVVYGSKRCRRVRLALKSLFGEERDFRSYGEEKIRTLYESRHRETGVAFADYFRCESRKDFQGRFRGTDFFVRYVKDFSEADEEYGSVHYKALAYGSVEAMVVDDEEAMFTPCSYPLEDARMIDSDLERPREIVSFRGQFCEQAQKGERIVARGKLERLSSHTSSWSRLLLGNTTRDFMTAYPRDQEV